MVEKFNLDERIILFSCEDNQSLEEPPQGHGKVFLTGSLQDFPGWAGCWIILSRIPFPLEVGSHDLLMSLPTWAVP